MTERFDANGRALYPWEVDPAPVAKAPEPAPLPEVAVEFVESDEVEDEDLLVEEN